ncbi:hypothetical protein [Photobacterium nomapromontoriensis]|uniref:hypothetical protein n=1 Tax=Photobacterium nomapromontoriensis TaxID=2910237 RepID=UPI003D0C5A73
MKRFIIMLSMRNKLFSFSLNHVVGFFSKSKYEYEVDRRKKIEIFNYKELVKPLPFYYRDYIFDNSLYGIDFVLKRYCGVDQNIKLNGYIEHGLFLGDLVKQEQLFCFVNKIITFSSNRTHHLINGGVKKKIVAIGSYINYAQSLLDKKQLSILKDSLGRTLLVFPVHSGNSVNLEYNYNEMISRIEKVRMDEGGFDNVLICLYWLDCYKDDICNAYLNKGYKIVTAGHRLDKYFLDRLKSIIELSDATYSNKVGTHVGYCISMNKPHLVDEQKIKITSGNKKHLKAFNSVRSDKNEHSQNVEIDEISDFCSSMDLDRNKDALKLFWGDNTLTRVELHRALFSK